MSRVSRPGMARRRDAGETLIELLVTMLIMGVTGLAIAGGLSVALSAAVTTRQQAQVEKHLRTWAETIANGSDGSYTSCSSLGCYQSLEPTPPSGISGSVVSVECWSGTAFAGCGTDVGIRRVRLAVTASGGGFPGFSRNLDVVVRRPCAGTSC